MRSPGSFVLACLMALAIGCGSEDGGDGGGGDVDAGTGADAANACLLPSQSISCTLGDNTPCESACGGSYCHEFGQLGGNRCTQNCTVGSTDQCPSGWSCNNMGRCRPPS